MAVVACQKSVPSFIYMLHLIIYPGISLTYPYINFFSISWLACLHDLLMCIYCMCCRWQDIRVSTSPRRTAAAAHSRAAATVIYLKNCLLISLSRCSMSKLEECGGCHLQLSTGININWSLTKSIPNRIINLVCYLYMHLSLNISFTVF